MDRRNDAAAGNECAEDGQGEREIQCRGEEAERDIFYGFPELWMPHSVIIVRIALLVNGLYGRMRRREKWWRCGRGLGVFLAVRLSGSESSRMAELAAGGHFGLTVERGGMIMARMKADHTWWHHVVTALAAVLMYGALTVLGAEIAFIGYLAFVRFPYPFSMIVGMGLGGIGISLFFVFLYELLVRVLSVRYTRTHCVVCRRGSASE